MHYSSLLFRRLWPVGNFGNLSAGGCPGSIVSIVFQIDGFTWRICAFCNGVTPLPIANLEKPSHSCLGTGKRLFFASRNHFALCDHPCLVPTFIFPSVSIRDRSIAEHLGCDRKNDCTGFPALWIRGLAGLRFFVDRAGSQRECRQHHGDTLWWRDGTLLCISSGLYASFCMFFFAVCIALYAVCCCAIRNLPGDEKHPMDSGMRHLAVMCGLVHVCLVLSDSLPLDKVFLYISILG